MNQTLGRLGKMKEEEYSSFVRVLFGLSSPCPVSDDDGEIAWVDPSLNDSQKEAIRFALGSREVALIHGPPGVSLTLSPAVDGITDNVTDWQDTYFDRAHFADVKAKS
jgi:DNA polymerase alpha-associated DNA helicase A